MPRSATAASHPPPPVRRERRDRCAQSRRLCRGGAPCRCVAGAVEGAELHQRLTACARPRPAASGRPQRPGDAAVDGAPPLVAGQPAAAVRRPGRRDDDRGHALPGGRAAGCGRRSGRDRVHPPAIGRGPLAWRAHRLHAEGVEAVLEILVRADSAALDEAAAVERAHRAQHGAVGRPSELAAVVTLEYVLGLVTILTPIEVCGQGLRSDDQGSDRGSPGPAHCGAARRPCPNVQTIAAQSSRSQRASRGGEYSLLYRQFGRVSVAQKRDPPLGTFTISVAYSCMIVAYSCNADRHRPPVADRT